MEITLYHASLHSGLKNFNPFSHFGSKFAATEAVFRRLHLGEKGSPSLYKVTINIPHDNSIEIPDWASPRPRNIALELASHFADDRSDQFNSIAESISIKEAGDKDLRASLFERISENLLPDVKGIYYKNKHEGEYDEKTLCLVCTNCISNIESEEFDHDEVERVKKLLKQKLHRTL